MVGVLNKKIVFSIDLFRVLVLSSSSMEFSSSIISKLPFFLRRRNLLPDVNGGAVRLNLSSFVPSDFASSDRFWIFSYGCHEDCPCNICPGCYVLDNGDSYSRLPSDVDQVVRLFRPDILVLVLLPMWYDRFNGCVRACSLGIAAQIKIMGELSLMTLITCLDTSVFGQMKVILFRTEGVVFL